MNTATNKSVTRKKAWDKATGKAICAAAPATRSSTREAR